MAPTVTSAAATDQPRYEYYYRDSSVDNKREVLTDSRAVETFTEIPVVDISRIFSQDRSEREAIAKEIAGVCKDVGFMYIKGHGISQVLVNKVYDISRRYHAQPAEVNMKQYIYNNERLRGFDRHYVNTPEGEILRKSSFIYSYDPDNDPVPPRLTPEQRDMCLGVYNQWPTSPPGLKEVLLSYQRQLLNLARKMMQSFALGLGAEETYFDKYITAPFVSIILQHYYPTEPGADDPDSLGAHTDFETFTILSQDTVGGLEILNKNGTYVPAPYIPETFVVNIGDFLERVSNDIFVSTVHRVRNATGKERYSIPFFFSFNMDANVGVLPSCTSPKNPAKYSPRNLHEYTKKKRHTQKINHEAPGLDNPLAT